MKNLFKFLIVSLFLWSGVAFYNSSLTRPAALTTASNYSGNKVDSSYLGNLGLTAIITYFDGWEVDCDETIVGDCTVSTGGGGSGMSGTLTPSSTFCEIPQGQRSCPITLSWSVTDPEVIFASAVTSSTDNNGNSSSNFTISPPQSTGNPDSGTKADVSVIYPSRTFFLYNNAQSLVPTAESPNGTGVIVTATCASDLGWDGSKCASSPLSPTLTSFYPVPGCIDTVEVDGGGADDGTGGNAPVCGNGACEAGEDAGSCPADCGGDGGGDGGGGFDPEQYCSNLCSSDNGNAAVILGVGIIDPGGSGSCYENCMANNGGGIVEGAESVPVTYYWTGSADSCSSPATHLFTGEREGINEGSDQWSINIDPTAFTPVVHTIQCERNYEIVSRSYTLESCDTLLQKKEFKYKEK